MKASNEYEYLLHLLRCALEGTVPENIPEGLCMERVLDIGIFHEAANMAFPAVKRLPTQPEKDILDRWQQEYAKAVKRDLTQSRARAEILDALHAHGIYTLELQGTVVKQYYPQRHLRMMSDIDIIIPFEKLDEAEGIMQSLGYATQNPNGIEVDAAKGIIAVELHTEFFDTVSVTRTALSRPYSHAVCGENYTATVSDTVFYLFHLLHTIKHCGQRGSGLRRIIDLYYLEEAMKDRADQEYIDRVLREHGFYEMKKQLLAVKDHWFRGIEPETDLSELETDILESGNHGTAEKWYTHKFARERAEGKRFVKLRYLLRLVFPKKERIYRSYPFCEKHRLPSVLCWVYRWFASMLNREKWQAIMKIVWRVKNS